MCMDIQKQCSMAQCTQAFLYVQSAAQCAMSHGTSTTALVYVDTLPFIPVNSSPDMPPTGKG